MFVSSLLTFRYSKSAIFLFFSNQSAGIYNNALENTLTEGRGCIFSGKMAPLKRGT